MRLAKGIKQNLSTGFIQEYLQLYQYNMQGVLIKVENPPTANTVTFTLRLNGNIIISDTILLLNVSETTVDIPYSVILYQNDVLTFECTSCIDAGVGNSVFFGIY